MSVARIDVKDGSEVVPSYSRAVRVGAQIHVSGTTSRAEDGTVVGRTTYEQTVEIYRKISWALTETGAGIGDVVRVVAYCTDMNASGEFLRAHTEAMQGNAPASTLVEVTALIDPAMLIEIEAYAIVDEE